MKVSKTIKGPGLIAWIPRECRGISVVCARLPKRSKKNSLFIPGEKEQAIGWLDGATAKCRPWILHHQSDQPSEMMQKWMAARHDSYGSSSFRAARCTLCNMKLEQWQNPQQSKELGKKTCFPLFWPTRTLPMKSISAGQSSVARHIHSWHTSFKCKLALWNQGGSGKTKAWAKNQPWTPA